MYVFTLLVFCNWNKHKAFMGKTLRVREAAEPSDVCYHNLESSKIKRGFQQIVTLVWCSLLLMISFFILKSLSGASGKIKLKLLVSRQTSKGGKINSQL